MASTQDPEVKDLLHKIYDTTTKQFSFWFPIFREMFMPFQNTLEMNAIHLAAFNGHDTVIQDLLARGDCNINTADGNGSYPVIWAALNGHEDVVSTLLKHGADVDAQGGYHGNALSASSSEGHDQIVQTLLEPDVNVRGGYHGNLYKLLLAKDTSRSCESY
jgi:ankyrin repeat protein